MPSFVKGVKRRIRRLKQIIHAGHPHDGPETTPGTDRCLSPALHEVVGGIPCPPVTIPASPRSSTSTDTMAVAGGLMGGKEVGLSDAVASSRGSSHYSTAETAIFGDIESDRSSSLDATRPVSSQSVALDASTSTYSTASEGSEAHLPNILEAVIEPMSAPSSSTEEPQLDEQPESHPVPVAEEQSTEPVLEVTVDVAAEPEPEVSLQNDSQSQLTASPPPPESTESIPPEEEDTSDRAPGEPREEIPFTSPPPPVLVEPPVPDPFLVDDSESSDAGSEREPQAAPVTSDSQLSESMHPAEEISLAASATLPTPSQPSPAPLPSPNLNKSVPPTPAPISDDEEDEEETPEVYLPALVHPTMFLPIPNVRLSSAFSSLTWWLSSSRRRLPSFSYYPYSHSLLPRLPRV
ncbi:hypothetical protein GLOTRDRAFT_138022 [Gloeophyllum trabeum ATCC 11539]|uniref:Uncharacterized protein n=1 Tax=Gloeophyllum trabeum (strain ATCC 11539 / FP-39264 / Madison 617) TaxID=670483 RepID=S7RT08_GLOTA|nr:uncharacterized protein GLOTRDRAFT_138022 [Gloeophyllum trabeum ATCC 11539]EPQ56229.1 hypothetical protein GLOTRDRAFT_138022 [Gloeophyllum trabeum ATCC 11539]